MDERELKMLESLETAYLKATFVCDPIEFQKRQQMLLYELAKFLLTKLDDYREGTKQDS